MPTSPRSGRPRKLSPTHHRHERTSTRYLSGTTEHGTPYVEEHRSERTTIRRYGEEASMERERRGSSPQRESRAGRRSAPYHPQPHPRASSHRGRPSSRRSSNGSSYVCDTPRGASRPSRATSARTSHTPQPREHGRRSTSRSHRPSRRSSAFTDRGEFDEYRTPARRDDGRFSVGGASRSRSRRTSMSVAQPRRASNGGCATFRVRIFEGRGLLTQSEIARGMHLSIAVHNANERGRTGVVAGSSANLRFHDEFRFTSADPSRDALVCTLVATGPNLNVSRSSTMGAGERDQRVGECVISLRHVLWQHEREVWVPMVRRPGTEEAYERGELLISIYSDDFGYDETLANDTDAFAEEVHEVLMRYGRSDLHRFDCIVGHTIPQGRPGLDRLRVRYRANHDDEMHIVYLTVRDVEDLCAADGSLGPGRSTAPITVVVGALEEEMRSQPTNYRRGQAVVRQEFRLALEDPLKDAISIIVFAAGHRVAEAQIGLTNIIAGVAKELDVQLVSSAETGDAVVCGMMHVVLRTESYTSAFSMTEEEEAQMRNRVRGFLWANLRDELHRLEYILSTVGPNKEAFMRKWARRVGAAEPTRHELLLTVQGCSPAAIAITDLDKTRSTKGPRTAPVSSTRRHYFVRISTGYSISRTDVVRAKEDGRLVFAHHEEMLNIFTPRTCAVEYILVEVRDGEERELRRVVMGVWTLPREQRVVRELHLVAAAGSCSAALSGFLVVELTAMDFGVHQPETEERAERRNRCIEELENLARDGGMDRLHRVGYVVDTTAPGNEESLIEAQAHAQGSTLMMSGPGGMDASAMIVESAPMQVRILGIREFVAAGNQAYVKAYLGPRAILRTRDKAAIAGTISYDIDDGNEVSDTLHRHECGERLELKVAQHRGFRSHVYARTSVALQALVCDHPNELWLPLFCEDGGAVAGGSRGDGDALRANHLPTTVGPSVAPLGYLGVRLESSAFVNRLPIYRGADYGEPGQPFMEALMRDVGTLLAKYAPSQLPRAHILIAECSSLSTAHDELRARLCPRPVRLTLFLHVEGLAIHDAELARQERRGGIAVYATFLEEGQEGAPRPLLAMDGGDGGAYASIRLDVCDPSAAAPQVAKSWLANDLAAPPLELRLMGVRPTRPATGADRDANPLQPQVGELGLVRLSLRALLSHKFYRLGEPFTVPIVASSSSSDDVEEAACVLGHITCRLSTAAGDVAPAGLTLGGPRAYSSAEARSIVASAHRISSYLDQASPAHLRDCHYHLYEDDVASGRWPTSLRDWANELKQLCRSSSRQQQQHHRR